MLRSARASEACGGRFAWQPGSCLGLAVFGASFLVFRGRTQGPIWLRSSCKVSN